MSWINEYTKEKPCGGSREVADGSANGHARRPLGSIPRAGHCCARPSKDVGGQLSGWAPTPSPWA